MSASVLDAPLLVVVGSGGVGKTTLAAGLALRAAREGHRTLVMTFDPSRRLKDVLGIGSAAEPVRVATKGGGELDASLLDAGATFDRLVARYAPDDQAARRILGNRFYRHLAGGLAGILEYMAVERLFEIAAQQRYDRIILDTPPTSQALEFLEAPERIIRFLDSGAVQVATRSWFDERGRLRAGRLRVLGRGIEQLLDSLVGLDLLRDIAEFFQAFGPLYAGFRSRAGDVQRLLRSERTRFLLVAGAGQHRVADTMYFARKLDESGCRLGAIAINQVFPPVKRPAFLAALGERDRRAVKALRGLLPGRAVATLPLIGEPPAGLADLESLGRTLAAALR